MKHLAKIVYLLICFLGIYHAANGQQNIAQQTFSIFNLHCLNCHGEFGSFTNALVMMDAELIALRAVIPVIASRRVIGKRYVYSLETLSFVLNPTL